VVVSGPYGNSLLKKRCRNGLYSAVVPGNGFLESTYIPLIPQPLKTGRKFILVWWSIKRRIFYIDQFRKDRKGNFQF